jgi:hypothetical protein
MLWRSPKPKPVVRELTRSERYERMAYLRYEKRRVAALKSTRFQDMQAWEINLQEAYRVRYERMMGDTFEGAIYGRLW